MLDTILDPIRLSPAYFFFNRIKKWWDLTLWRINGRKNNVPKLFKEKIVKQYAHRNSINVFVESGTYRGDMVRAIRDDFSKIYSIELSPTLANLAKKRFKDNPNVVIKMGNSADALSEILPQIDEPCIFWLDAHWSGGVTGKANLHTPIRKELDCILNHPISSHVILVDDARCFNGENDYPTFNEVKELVLKKYPDHIVENKDDIIRIYHESEQIVS
jgi:hypothetical protein